ncbi:MAG: 4-hydroxy-tetrahydrodipicolinate reductase [Olsenella sp.]|nr:4-hydroxy-tetrahydrodipicolinate reductase [Olsenella sp.]
MGSLIASTMAEQGGFEIVGTYDVGNADDLDMEAPAADLAVDFSNKSALSHVLAYVSRTGAALVSGTTGFDEAELARLRALGHRSAVVHSANYSIGVAVLRRLTAEAASALSGFDVEIVETHHNQKADAPSGTANLLLAAVDPDGSDPVAYGREGMVGARPEREIGMHSLRGGTVAGTHEVHFFGPDEEVCLTHRATSRQIFVNGAVACARKIVGKEPGFYTFDQLMFEN